jgi:hypothetical protein
MADPFITPLVAGAVAGALIPTTVNLSEIEAWIKGKRPGLKASKGRATITWENASGRKIIVKATVYSLVDPFLPGKPRPEPLGSRTWKGDRLDRALKSRFNGRQSFDVPLSRHSAKD